MSFTENLKVEIESVFDSAGFRQLEKRIKSAKSEFMQLNAVMSNARGMADMRKRSRMFQDRLDRTSFSLQNVSDDVQNMGLGQLAEKFSVTGDEASRVRQQVRQFGGVIRNSNGDIAKMGNLTQALTNQFDQIGAMQDKLPKSKDIDNPMAQFQSGGAGVSTDVNFSETERRTNRLRRVFMRLARASGISSERMNDIGVAAGRASAGLSFLSKRARGAAASLSATSFSLQNLQMRLLGVQFSLLSLAFIFGGLMGSALGAVGIFKILGNTLKMFFLPTALELLPAVMDIRDAILGVGEDTRKTVGRIFLIVAAIGALGSILAFTASGVLGFLQGIGMLLSPLAKLVLHFTKAKSIMAALTNAWGMLTSAAGGILGALGAILSFLGGFIAGFKVVNFIINQVSAVLGVLLTVLLTVGAAILAFTGLVTAPFWVVAAAVGAAIGAIIAVLWNFRGAVVDILTGVAGFFMDIFKGIFNFLVGNSIIPDMVNKIIDWLFKLPKSAFNAATSMVNSIVKGIKGIGSGIWDAFKQVLPGFVVDALEGTAQAVGNVTNAVGNFAGGAANAVQNFASGAANAAGNLNPFGGNNNTSQSNVQQNNINAQVEVNDKEETPQETGRVFGQGLSNELNSRQSNFGNGT